MMEDMIMLWMERRLMAPKEEEIPQDDDDSRSKNELGGRT